MNPLEALGLALGAGFSSGLNLYATVATLGLLQRFGIIHLPDSLEVVGHPIVLGIAVALYLVEFFADKVPYLDTIWDAAHTFVRPPAAAIIAYGAAGGISPHWRWAAALLAGGVALTGTAPKPPRVPPSIPSPNRSATGLSVWAKTFSPCGSPGSPLPIPWPPSSWSWPFSSCAPSCSTTSFASSVPRSPSSSRCRLLLVAWLRGGRRFRARCRAASGRRQRARRGIAAAKRAGPAASIPSARKRLTT